jgi:hypothetical protein
MAGPRLQGARRRLGYPALADLMGQHGGMAMYKQFASLSAHSLLMQQVELMDMQRELGLQAELDNKQNLGFDEKATASIHSQSPDNRQWQLVLNIRLRLKEYRRCRAASKSSTADRHDKQTKPCYGKPRSKDYRSLRSTIWRSCGTGSAEEKVVTTSSPV